MSPMLDDISRALSSAIPDAEQRETAARAVLRQLNVPSSADAASLSADVDLARATRCGFPEVIYGEGKPRELIVQILQQQQSAGQIGFVTRVSTETSELLLTAFPKGVYNSTGRTFAAQACPAEKDALSGTVAVVTAGSCDGPVAQEAVETLKWMGVPVQLIEDAGVAGPHRLLRHIPLLQSVTAVVVVAGMEGALPSVVGGYVRCPVIGVPTSVGYGASLGGVTALLSMLTSCASNVVTVNVDSGFRGGYVAGVIARQTGPLEKAC